MGRRLHSLGQNSHSNLFQTRDQLSPAGMGITVQPGLNGVDLAIESIVPLFKVICNSDWHTKEED